MVFLEMLRAAILGAGGMGQYHGSSLGKIRGVELAAVCGSTREKAEALIKRLDTNANAYSNFDEMLRQEKLDMLFICLPPGAHCGQFEKAANKGIHIFIEKPIAIDSVRGLNMVKAARTTGIHTFVGFHMRYGTAIKKLKLLIDADGVGRPVLFNGRYQCNSLHTPWWRDVYQCGGQVFEQAIHIYDMCRFFFGDAQNTIGRMGNVCHAQIAGYTVEDVSASISQFPSGAIASITATNCAVPEKWDAPIDVVFEKLSVHISDPNTAVFSYILPDGSVKEEHFYKPTDPKFDEVECFIKLIREGGRSPCPIEEGLRSLYFVEAVVESATMDGQKTPVKHRVDG